MTGAECLSNFLSRQKSSRPFHSLTSWVVMLPCLTRFAGCSTPEELGFLSLLPGYEIVLRDSELHLSFEHF